jgi:hypothetical protein
MSPCLKLHAVLICEMRNKKKYSSPSFVRCEKILGDKGFLLKVHKIENFFDSDFGICVFSLLVMSKY